VRGEESSPHGARSPYSEIPPRARGRGTRAYMNRLTEGNTPACAGKSHRLPILIHRDRKYPRVRGEEHRGQHERELAWEIPPRARGRVMRMMISALLQGNTPACAGKRRPVAAAVWPAGKYPRVRGEEKRMIDQADSRLEIPPRARGRVSRSCFLSLLIGNTPACAGKSRHLTARDLLTRKYPRVRGEELTSGL